MDILELLFNPRTLTGTAIKRKPVPRLLQNLFFKRRSTHLTKDIDLRKLAYNLKVLPMVGERSGATVIEGSKRTLQIVPSARLRASRASAANDLVYVTGPNEPVELKPGIGDVADRVKSAVVSDIDILADSNELTIEFMCSDLLRTGKVVAHDGDDASDYEVDFGMPPDHTAVLPPSDYWTADGADPLDQLEDFATVVQDTCGMRPDVVIHGTEAFSAFKKNTTVRETLDNRHIDAGTMHVNIAQLYKGNTGGVDHYVYGGAFPDVHGNSRELFPAKGVLLGCRNAPCSVEFGLPADLSVTGPVEKFLKTVIEEDPSYLKLIQESRPLPVADMDFFLFIPNVVG